MRIETSEKSKIPKIIHYCWFGNGDMPKIAEKCIRSWKKYCPDYKVMCWNETNFDLMENRYVKEAYQAGKWAFVSDYVRLKVVYEHGGVYLDTDVELIKPLDNLLETGSFMGFDEKGIVASGLGFAAEVGNPVIGAFLQDYEEIPFLLEDGTYDLTPCPDRNTETLKKLGMDVENTDQTFMGMRFLPEDYLCPMDYYTGKKI